MKRRTKQNILIILILLISVLLNGFLAVNLVEISKENTDLKAVVQELEQNEEQAEFSFITKGSKE